MRIAGRGNSLIPLLYVLPMLLLSGGFLYYSIGFTAFASFHEWNGVSFDMDYVGLANYKEMADDPAILTALKNTLLFFVVAVGIQTIVGLIAAVLVRARLPGHNLFKGIFFMPVIMAPIIIAGIFRILFDTNMGAINQMLRAIGLDALAVAWLGDPTYAFWSLVIVNLFNWMGFTMLLYYASLLAIPNEIYESATIDGAGFWRTLFGITLPLVNGTTTTLIILGIIGSLKTFDIVMLLTGGGPGRATEFLNTYLYKKFIGQFNGGYASAIGMLILVLAVSISMLQTKLYDRTEQQR